jgi:hypothetical protein
MVVMLAKMIGPRGVRSVAAEALLLKHQLVISNRSRQRAPNLTTLDRFVLGLISLFREPAPDFGAVWDFQARNFAQVPQGLG